jgi:hypothetical protein
MIYDTDGNRKLSSHIELRPSEVKTESVLIDCLTGYQIAGHAVTNVTIECKHDGDAYVNIETTPISLTPWDGTQEPFTFRYTAGAHVSADKRQFNWTVGRA